jgi:isoquinoline 1-oxidoreductase subunit alpha
VSVSGRVPVAVQQTFGRESGRARRADAPVVHFATVVNMSSPPPSTAAVSKVSFRVNGQPVTLDAPADMPLLWALRDLLDLRGTKYGCGIAQCGACTVHRDGAPIRSCLTRVGQLEGAEITTIEGLSPGGSHPLQRAWEEIDVAQCGYCQSGQIMSAAALLARSPRPSDDEIDAAMNGNLCRCATYLRIREAIHRAAALPAVDAAAQQAPAGREEA